jgi:hypothetical protein
VDLLATTDNAERFASQYYSVLCRSNCWNADGAQGPQVSATRDREFLRCGWKRRLNVEDGSLAIRSANHPAGSLEDSENMLAVNFLEVV